MRKHTHRRRIEPKAPMLVVMATVPELSITERMSVEAFAGGYATTHHFDNLADCRDLLTLAATERHDNQVLHVCELGLVTLLNIKDRYTAKGRMGTAGDELRALRLLADTSEDFWLRQAGGVFERHYRALKRARQIQSDARG